MPRVLDPEDVLPQAVGRVILRRQEGADLWLYGRTVAWRIGPGEVRQVRDWLRRGCPP